MRGCQSPIEMSLALPIRDVTRGQGIAFCRPLRSRPWRQAARLSWSGLLGRAAADPSLGRVTFQTGRVVTFLSGVYSPSLRPGYVPELKQRITLRPAAGMPMQLQPRTQHTVAEPS